MKNTVVALALCALMTTSAAALTDSEVTFAGISWGSSPSEVSRVMADLGFRHLAEYQELDEIYEGKLAGELVAIVCFFSAKQALVKVTVAHLNFQADILAKYQEVKADLTARFGKPSVDVQEYEDPYRAGDGNEVQAILVGQGILAALWEQEDGTVPLTVQITPELNVAVQFNSDRWLAEERRRSSETAGNS